MGSGIAVAFANGGYEVVVVDADAAALERCREFVADNYASQVAKGRLDASEAAMRTANIRGASQLSAVAECRLVIEAVYESLALKQSIFKELNALVRDNCMLATNTSTLDIDAVTQAVAHRESCLGMHFFSPAHVMKLVEVIPGQHTSEITLDAVCAIARAIGKVPVVVGNADGFVGNRMLLGYRREAEFLVLAGALPGDVDAALVSFGFAMGPFAVADLAGIDVGVRAKQERAQRGQAPPFALTNISDRLVEAGRLGRKRGAGYFHYSSTTEFTPDDLLLEIVADERQRLGIAQRTVHPEEIVEHCVFALVNEGARLLEAGIARSANDIDTIWRLGYGFPAARGGPMEYAASLGYDRVLTSIERFARDDATFWTVAPFLRQWAARPATVSE